MCFSYQIESHTAKLSDSAVLKHIYGNWQKYLSFRTKKCFSYHNEPHTAKLSFSAILMHFYGILQKKPYLVKKVFFSSKWATYSYTKLFCCFEAFLQKLTNNLSFGSNNYFSLQIEPTYSNTKFSAVLMHFYGMWQKNIVLVKKVFSLQNESNTAKLCISALLMHFYGLWQKNSFYLK